jgi:hypothetical protein
MSQRWFDRYQNGNLREIHYETSLVTVVPKNFFFTSSVMQSIEQRGTSVCCVKSLGRLLRGPGNSRRASFNF